MLFPRRSAVWFVAERLAKSAQRGLAIREPSDRFDSRQAVPDLHHTLHRPCGSQLFEVLLACEAIGIGICRLWFVTRSDVTLWEFGSSETQHRLNERGFHFVDLSM
jgi:hypothetical protein